MHDTFFFFTAIWIYVFICIAALWYWVKKALFRERKRWFFLAVLLSLFICFCVDESMVEDFFLYTPFLTPLCLWAVGKLRGISFSRAEHLVAAVLSVPCVEALLVAWMTIMVGIYGV